MMEPITITLDRGLVGLLTMVFLRILESLALASKKKGNILFETLKEFFRFG